MMSILLGSRLTPVTGSFSLAQIPVYQPPGSGTETTHDHCVWATEGIEADQKQIIVSIAGYDEVIEPEFESQDEGAGTTDQAGLVSLVENSAPITVRIDGRKRKIHVTKSALVEAFLRFETGTLEADITDAMLAAISGETPGAASQNLFSSASDPSSYTRNAGLLASQPDLTPLAAYTSTTGKNFLPTRIASDGIMFAKHTKPFGWTVGMTIYFVTAANVIRTATVQAIADVAGTDISVARISGTLTGIGIAKLLPADWTNTVNDTALHQGIPVYFGHDDNRRIGIGHWHYADGTMFSIYRPDHTFTDWYITPNSGTSGYPVFLPDLFSGEMCLLGQWFFPEKIPQTPQYLSDINAALTAAGCSGQVSTANLSGW